MEVSGLTNTTRTANEPTPPNQELGKDEFLKLLVAQLSNQDPLDPQDGAAFVAQLATFTNVEQLTSVNEGLDRISAGQAGLLQSQNIGLVGRTAVFSGNRFELATEGTTPLHYELPEDAGEVRIEIKNSAGQSVGSFAGPTGAGFHDIAFDGYIGDEKLPPGSYTFEVHADSGSIQARTYTTAAIDGITFESGSPILMAGELRIAPADILRVLN